MTYTSKGSMTLNARWCRLNKALNLLRRIGQHLFLEWRAKGRQDKYLEDSFECIWALKRQIRTELANVHWKPNSSEKKHQHRSAKAQEGT